MLACRRVKSMKLPLFRFILPTNLHLIFWTIGDLLVLPPDLKHLWKFWFFLTAGNDLVAFEGITGATPSSSDWFGSLNLRKDEQTSVEDVLYRTSSQFHVSGWKFDMEATDNLLIDDILMSKNLAKSSSYCLLLLGFVHPKVTQDFTLEGWWPKRPACNRRLAPRLVSRRWDNLKTSLVKAVGSRWERTKQNGISLYIHDITKGIVKITWKSWHST